MSCEYHINTILIYTVSSGTGIHPFLILACVCVNVISCGVYCFRAGMSSLSRAGAVLKLQKME